MVVNVERIGASNAEVLNCDTPYDIYVDGELDCSRENEIKVAMPQLYAKMKDPVETRAEDKILRVSRLQWKTISPLVHGQLSPPHDIE